MPQTLIDVMVFQPRIMEKSDDGFMRIEGVFQRSDTKNANGRIYPRKIWERILKEGSPVRSRMTERAMIGHLEHPSDGVTDLRKGSHIITDLKLDEKGQVLGTAELLDTPDGKIAQEYINRNIRIGISSRGKGSVGADGRVTEDYELETFDLVYNPSTLKAYPTSVKEDVTTSDSDIHENKEDTEMSMNEAMDRLRLAEGTVKTLTETKVGELPPFQLSDLEGKLLETSVNLGALAVEAPALAGAVEGLQKRINEKRDEISKTLSGDVKIIEEDEEIDENADDELDEDVEDVEALGALLEAATDQVEEAEVMQEASESLFEAMKNELAESKAYADVLEDRLSAATELISALTAADPAAAIKEAVAEMIENDPRLAGVESILSESASAEEVYARAAQISDTLGEEEDEDDEEDIDLSDFEDEDDEEDVDENFNDINTLFEDIEDIDEDISSEDDVSTGLIESARDSAVANHKGHKLAVAAVKRL